MFWVRSARAALGDDLRAVRYILSGAGQEKKASYHETMKRRRIDAEKRAWWWQLHGRFVIRINFWTKFLAMPATRADRSMHRSKDHPNRGDWSRLDGPAFNCEHCLALNQVLGISSHPNNYHHIQRNKEQLVLYTRAESSSIKLAIMSSLVLIVVLAENLSGGMILAPY